MKTSHAMKETYLSLPAATLILFLGILCLSGCLPGNKPPQLTEQFTIEYARTEPLKLTPVPHTIRIERFSTAQAYNSLSMIYKPESYRLASYNYNRWRVTPGDMVTDYLVRDLRDSGMFIGVFSYREMENARFVLEGGVEEFLEVDTGGAGRALLSLSIALIDTTQSEVTKRLIFQRNYRREEPLKEQAPAALAQGMSAAMKKLSGEVAKDIYESVQTLGK
jgi:ABC-type uncharacterized transport system auxiliary subunit